MTERSLQDFFDMLRSAQQANYAKFPDPHAFIEKIDQCFVRANENLIYPVPAITGILLSRGQYAFETAAGMALAGQVVETFVMLRSVLEYAGYCFLICKTPSLEGVFLSRHINTKAMATQKKAFTTGAIKSAIRQWDTTLADIFVENYERSISFGAHPNSHAALSATAFDERAGATRFTALAISNDPSMIGVALKSTAQVGWTALRVFQHVFAERFELLGIRQEIDALENTGLL